MFSWETVARKIVKRVYVFRPLFPIEKLKSGTFINYFKVLSCLLSLADSNVMAYTIVISSTSDQKDVELPIRRSKPSIKIMDEAPQIIGGGNVCQHWAWG